VTAEAAVLPLRLTGHPLQRCGARAVTALAGASAAGDVTPAVLDEVAARITGDVVRAAAAAKAAVSYDWWKVLFALYPNSPATHSKRSPDLRDLRESIGRLFAPDPPGSAASPCAFCGLPAGTLWAKDKLPMFDSLKAVNTLPPGLPGWPVCRGCRIAMWALPYGAWVTAGSATVMTCADEAVERRFVARNVRRARRIQQLGFTGLPAHATAETVTLGALREHAAGAATGSTLWLFKNDNQDAWLRVTATRGGIPAFLRRLFADPQCRAGWRALQRALTERDKDGQIKASGIAAAAKTLFDPADRPGGPAPDRLQRELLRQAGSLERLPGRTLAAWQALCRLHLEVVHGMDTGQVKPARELIVDWITQEPNPRGRFNRYVKASARWSDLQKLLMEASARLLLDGGHPPDITAAAESLLAPDVTGWRLRGQLFFDVVAELVNRGAPIGHRPEPGEPDEEADELSGVSFDPPVTDNETEEYA
jgi:CRISPR-associated protein Cst1